LAIVVFWHTRKRWIRALVVVVTVSMPFIVGIARMYRGMHHLTDVIAGALLGVTSVVLVTVILCRAEDRRRSREMAREVDGARSAPADLAPDVELAPPIVVPTGNAS